MWKRKLAALSVGAAMILSAGAALAGDAGNGEAVFKKNCKMCHTVDQGGKSRMGPNLFAIVGKTAGSADFAKYKSLKGSTVVWSDETLDSFLADPNGFAGGKTGMKPMADAASRADVIAYMKTLK